MEGQTVASQVAALPPLSKLLGTPLSSNARRSVAEEVPKSNWKRIEESMNADFVYRSDTIIQTTLSQLKEVPFFSELSKDELILLAREMELVHGKTSEVLVTKELPKTDDLDAAEDFSKGTILSSEMVGSSPVDVKDGKTTEPNYTVIILVEGKLLLELPSVNGKQHFPVIPLDCIGYAAQWKLLPERARYIGTEQFTYIKFRVSHNSPMGRVFSKCEELQINRQREFLRHSLNVKVFDKMPDSTLSDLATALLPIRLRSNQILVEEGTEADVMYFVVKGSLCVTRLIEYSEKKPNGRQKEGEVMDIATLSVGDMFGELALLGHNPDVRPGENVQWSADYWRTKLLASLNTDDNDLDQSQKDFVDMISKGKSAVTEGSAANSGGHSATAPSQRLPKHSALRKASVFSKTPCIVYRLGYEDCRTYFTGATLTRLEEFSKGYPSYNDLFQEYNKKMEWNHYKRGVVEEVLEK
ncbi:hypothetical protein AGDE_07773 [Angomonas deanei]|nr:hypothetical protein AGDE_07773 [Angomonas deanei]|eukprot:EPY34863.1 hypothetical protein AGDE_07773 [Angomonas deanei]